ncbi:DUF1640 domain-containing protein [Candidatus Magnetobacterium casense]|uniref:DUF1640 domain-containing protein n=1 Tax=Candidatus Magnetobacterium casense TaxID=1455061 RepID=UPI0005917BD0|nr:DUF1640 domain-containing protein [Candidatus Magnetobacterium casensis]
MNDTLIFDTHAYVKKLKAVGFTEEQAEVQAEAMSDLIEEGLATKRDLKELEVALKRDMKDLEVALKRDMDLLRRDMKELELRLSVRLGTIMAAGIAAIAVLMKLFSH